MGIRIMRQFFGLLPLVLILLAAGNAHASVIFAENYNNVTLGNVNSFGGDTCVNQACTDLKNHGWDFVRGQCGTYCSMQVVPAPFGQTGNALRYEYQSDQDRETLPTQDAMNSNLIKLFTPVSELWGQVYFATDVDTVACPTCTTSRWFCCNTKLHYIKPVGAGPSYVTGYQTGEFIPTPVPLGGSPSIGTQEMAVCPSGGTPVFKGGNGCNNNYQNTATPVRVYDKQWYCVVYHIKLNSSYTVSDGVLELWINGTKVQNYQNQKMVDGYYTLADSRIGQIEVYRQHSNHMIRYEDNFLLSTTALDTNCSGITPTSDTTPPLVPSGLAVR